MSNKEISLNSNLGKSKSPKNKIIAVVFIVLILIAAGIGYYSFRKANITEISVGLSNIKLTDELKTNMKSLAVDAQSYFNENKGNKVLTSQYGLLYSYKDKANVMTIDIAGDSSVDAKTMAEMDVLYVNSKDINADITDGELNIFVSVNSSDGYYVVSPKGEDAIFTEEEFKNLLMKYAPTHGEIINPQRGSEEHTAIVTAAGLSLNDIDIKHIACDNKYAVVVANEIKNPAYIQEIALIKEENGWKVVNDKLAYSENSYIDINSMYPDMDLGLMPIYNIFDFGKIKTSEMSGIADSLIQLGMMTSADKSTMYACGCDRFAYIQLENGKRLVGFIGDDGQLEFNEADDISSTIAYMLQCQENPPVFIARFE